MTEIHGVLKKIGNADIAEHSARFFKTGKGEYGEGDRFLGIRVPILRQQVAKFRDASLRTIIALLKSAWHEERLLAVLLLVEQYKRGDEAIRTRIFDAYITHREFVNNWDIVDSSAHLIVGPELQDKPKRLLTRLSESNVVWDRRIAMMSTYHYIRQCDYVEALRIAKKLQGDKHDLIHKVVGWMLREIGNRDRDVELAFLKQHYQRMPRTMLRYAIEKFDKKERAAYLDGRV